MIYLDNAATTPLDPRVLDAMQPYMTYKFYNPSTLYATEIAKAINDAKEVIASFVSCDPEGVIFTSGGTEADNLALSGTARTISKEIGRSTHILTSAIEHKAVLETCKHLEQEKIALVHYLKPDYTGFVNYMDVNAMLAIDPAIRIVSIMAVNNEIGTGQQLFMIGKYCQKCDQPVVFHTDAVQAISSERINMKALGIDMLSMSAHKFNGPKGIGALCVTKEAIKYLSPIMYGGMQQNSLRPGTENVAGIIGMAEAIKLLRTEWDARQAKLKELDTRMRGFLSVYLDDVIINGRAPKDGGKPGYISLSIKGVDAETMLMMLARPGKYDDGICASAGSACNTESIEVSHVLKAIDVPDDYIRGTIRLTLGHETTFEEVDIACEKIRDTIKMLREGEGV